MRTNFFTYQDELPAEAGFSLFGAQHILWLLFSGACIFLFLKRYRKWNEQARSAADRILGAFLPGLLLLRTLVLMMIGKLSVYELPLHLCSLAGILCFLYSFVKWDWLGQVLYGLCLPGAVLALLFPDGAYYPAIHFITIQSFLFHIGIISFVGCQLLSFKIRPRLSAVWKVFLFLLAVVPPIYLFDLKFRANYMYLLVPSLGSPFQYLTKITGRFGYLPVYAVLVILFVFLMEIIFLLFDRLSDRDI